MVFENFLHHLHIVLSIDAVLEPTLPSPQSAILGFMINVLEVQDKIISERPIDNQSSFISK